MVRILFGLCVVFLLTGCKEHPKILSLNAEACAQAGGVLQREWGWSGWHNACKR